MIADTIPLSDKTNEERGFPADSYYIVTFEDGSVRDERQTNWSSFSEIGEVKYFGKKKQVSVSKFRIAKIEVFHEHLHTVVEIPKNCEVYQAFSSEVSFFATGEKHSNLNGRIVGIIKEGEVIEERFLNAREGQVFGIKL